MSTRDVIAGILFEYSGSGQGVDEMLAEIATAQADAIISGLEASGRSIVHKDEIHAPSVERAIAVAVETYGSAKDWDYFGSAHVAIAAALRELMKEVG
jgi:hypothetical protein